MAELTLPLLTAAVESLKLSETRKDINGSASQVKVRDLPKAGVDTLKNLDAEPIATVLLEDESYASCIVAHLKEICLTYFSPMGGEIKGDIAPGVYIPVDIRDTIEGQNVKTDSDVANAIVSIVTHWVKNALEIDPNAKEHDPLVIQRPGSKSHEKTQALSQARKPQVQEDDQPKPRSDAPAEEAQDDDAGSGSKYPGLRISLLDSSHAEDNRTRVNTLKSSLAWFHALNLTAEPQGEGQRSEMTVQFVVGSVLRYLAQLPDCYVWSDLKLKYPQILKMSTRQGAGVAMPDIATRPNPVNADDQGSKKARDGDPSQQLLQPVIILGEAKRRDTGANKGSSENAARFTAQMAMAAYPSLISLILLHLNGKHFNPSNTESLPEEFFIYGTYYDEAQVILYAHFPYYSREHHGWRFVQVFLKQFNLATFGDGPVLTKENARRRLEFAVAMQAVREHGRKLHGLFTSERYRNVVEALTKAE